MRGAFERRRGERIPPATTLTTLTSQIATIACAIAIGGASAIAADITFLSTWKSPDAKPMDFAGKLVTALVIVDDDNLRMSAEEALAREITARGPRGMAAHRLIPREELVNKERAKPWFDKAGVD